MNRMWNIVKITLLMVLAVGCSKTEDLNLEQRNDIVDYLEGKHDPKLLSENDAKQSLDDEPPFFVMKGQSTFRYISTFYDTNRASMPQISKGSKISIKYTLYNFEEYETPSETTILRSNDATQIALLEALNGKLNPKYWSTEPLTFTVGSGAIFGSVENLLVGCHQGDIIEFYMTLNEAYGNSVIGVSTADAPLAFFCEILTIN